MGVLVGSTQRSEFAVRILKAGFIENVKHFFLCYACVDGDFRGLSRSIFRLSSLESIQRNEAEHPA